jgi:ABC-type antimicrobial peptide transport system permease subunit
MAVGAKPSSVLRLILRHGWLPAGCGIVLGVIVSAGVGGLIGNALTGTGIDIGTYLMVVPAVLATVMVAACVPARRATRIDPLTALRQE